MSLVYIYFILAITTGMTAVYEILTPVMQRRISEGFHIENKFIMYLIFFVLTVILAPAVFLSCVIPSMGDKFKSSLYDGLFDKD